MAQRLLTHDKPSFADTFLPHHLFVNPERGVPLLLTPGKRKANAALGCAWDITPRNIEVCDEAVCLDMSKQHENVLRGLPVGSAVQSLMTVLPATSMPAWEHARQTIIDDPAVSAHLQAIRNGFPHRDGTRQCRLRQITTLMTVRIPITLGDIPTVKMVQLLAKHPVRAGKRTAQNIQQHLSTTLEDFESYATGIEDTLHGVGHGVKRLDADALAQALTQACNPLATDVVRCKPDIPLREQVLHAYAENCGTGWIFDHGIANHVLSLEATPSQTYPGMLSAPRGPLRSTPLALWDVWDGPLTVVVNIHIVDQEKIKAALSWQRRWAHMQGKTTSGDTSLESAALKKELDRVLTETIEGGGQLFWARIHLVLWGPEKTLWRGGEELIRAAKRMELGFIHEPYIGDTLFLQCLPLGFDPGWPHEQTIQREQYLPAEQIMDLTGLHGGMRGTETPLVPFINRRGEAISFSPFDIRTNAHMVITGTSGAGKSFIFTHILHHTLMMGGCAIVLDQGTGGVASYRELCEYWGGAYIEMDYNTPLCFNAFLGPFDKQHLANLSSYHTEMAGGGVDQLNQQERGVLAQGLAHFAAHWRQHYPNDEAWFAPFVEQFESGVFTHDEVSRSLARDIVRRWGQYTTGAYAGFVNGRNTFQIHPRITVIELSKLAESPDLMALILFAVMHLMTHLLASADRIAIPKIFGADEVWALLQHESIAPTIARIVRTYRKVNTSAVFLSQSVEDFDTPAGRVIRSVPATKLFLEQDSGELPLLQKFFRMTDAELALFTERNAPVQRHRDFSGSYLKLPGGQGGVVRLVSDPFVKMMAGQDPWILQARAQARAEVGGDMRKAMALLMELYPNAIAA